MRKNKVRACAIRGKTGGSYWKNGIEIREDGVSYALTTKGKDTLYIAEVNRVSDEDEFMNLVEEDDLSLPDLAEYRDENPDTEHTVEDYLYKDYGVFKLSPRECLRLMGVKDSDIDKMAAVNSNTQQYKQAGNSIVVSVLCAIFSQLNIKGCKAWNDMTDEERDRLIMPEPITNEYTEERKENKHESKSKQPSGNHLSLHRSKVCRS